MAFIKTIVLVVGLMFAGAALNEFWQFDEEIQRKRYEELTQKANEQERAMKERRWFDMLNNL